MGEKCKGGQLSVCGMRVCITCKRIRGSGAIYVGQLFHVGSPLEGRPLLHSLPHLAPMAPPLCVAAAAAAALPRWCACDAAAIAAVSVILLPCT